MSCLPCCDIIHFEVTPPSGALRNYPLMSMVKIQGLRFVVTIRLTPFCWLLSQIFEGYLAAFKHKMCHIYYMLFSSGANCFGLDSHGLLRAVPRSYFLFASRCSRKLAAARTQPQLADYRGGGRTASRLARRRLVESSGRAVVPARADQVKANRWPFLPTFFELSQAGEV